MHDEGERKDPPQSRLQTLVTCSSIFKASEIKLLVRERETCALNFYIYQKLRCEKSASFQCYIYVQASLHPEWRKGEGGNLSYINPQCVPSNIYSQHRMTFLLAAEINLSAGKIAFLFYQFLA